MPNDGEIVAQSVADALVLAHERVEELFQGSGICLPTEAQREVTNGVDAILVEVLSRYPAWQPAAAEFMTIDEASTLLFVSRPHVMKLLEQGQLRLHHKTGTIVFLTKTSVLDITPLAKPPQRPISLRHLTKNELSRPLRYEAWLSA